MRASAHVRLLSIAGAVWAAFWVVGLPGYYQQYSFTTMVVFSIALVLAIAVIALKVIGKTRVDRRTTVAFWLALYFTIPFALLDYLYCGLYLGHGFEFLRIFWYLTVFYFIPWLVFVPIGYWLRRRNEAVT